MNDLNNYTCIDCENNLIYGGKCDGAIGNVEVISCSDFYKAEEEDERKIL